MAPFLTCHPVVVRTLALEAALPWPHWLGALPSDEERPDFEPPAGTTHPFRRGEFYRRIRLHGDLDALEVGTVMAEIAGYNGATAGDDDEASGRAAGPSAADVVQRLCDDTPLVAAGGIEIEAGGEIIMSPQCCAGFEAWRDWLAFAEGGPPPWAGHDPDPHLSRLPSGDLAIGLPPREPRQVEPAALRIALGAVERDLAAFGACVARWAERVAPGQATGLADKLARDFAFAHA